MPSHLKVSSQRNPSQSISLSCVLTISAYTQFRSLLKPPRLLAGHPGEVLVSNQGNLPLSATVSLSSEAGEVEFSPEEAQEVRADPGEVATATFSASPVKKPWFGDQVTYPIQAQVRRAAARRRR